MLRKSHYILAGLVLVIVVVLLSLPRETSTRLKVAVSSLFLPLFGLASSAPAKVQRTGDAVVPRKLLQEELTQLRKDNQELRLRAAEGQMLRTENDRLRAAVNWKPFVPGNYKLGRVIGRHPANWWQMVRIDLGSRDNVQVNCPVMTPQGLVGRVANVGLTHSDVALIGDPNCHVAAMVTDTRDHGVIMPSRSALDPSIVDLAYLAKASNIQPGNRVATSGMGGIFPKGIPVGEIVDTRSVGYGLYTEARVRLAVNFNQVEEVWVLLR